MMSNDNLYQVATRFKHGQLKKPVANFTGKGNNIYHLLEIANKALRHMPAAQYEMADRVLSSPDCDTAMAVMKEYVDVK